MFIALMAFSSGLYAKKKKTPRKPDEPAATAAPAQMTPEQKVVHALDRLTFGPRPGDVDTVTAAGLDRWIEQQLHPRDIPENPALAATLAPFDTLRMSTSRRAALRRRYPSPKSR